MDEIKSGTSRILLLFQANSRLSCVCPVRSCLIFLLFLPEFKVELDAVTNQIQQVEKAITGVEKQIDKEQDKEEKKQLREEKKQLREEKKQLNERKNILLKQRAEPTTGELLLFCLSVCLSVCLTRLAGAVPKTTKLRLLGEDGQSAGKLEAGQVVYLGDDEALNT